MRAADRSHELAKRNMRAWLRELDGEGLDAILITASGCGTMVKDYGYVFRDDPEWREPSRRVDLLVGATGGGLCSRCPSRMTMT